MKTQSRPLFRLLVLSLTALLVFAFVACGGDDDDDPTATSAAAAATPTPAAATATTAAATPTTAAVAPTTPAATPTSAPEPTATTPAATPTTAATATPEPVLLEGDLTVFAAASLTASFEAIKELLEEANPDLTITYNFAGSQALVTQLTEGADADVFASANNTQMTNAVDAGVISGEPALFTRNRLAIIVPADNPAGIQEPADLANEGVKIVLANPDVPVGNYSLQVLDKMSADPEYGADFRANVEANVVSLEENVTQVVTKVQLGEADAGIVYYTDITEEVAPDVMFIEIPDEFNVIAEYPIAAVEGGNAELAQAFIDFLLSDEGQEIMISFNFYELPEE